MPLYEYRCPACETPFELLRSHSDESAVACPDCAGPVEKLFSAFAVRFRGDCGPAGAPCGERRKGCVPPPGGM